MHLCDRSLSVKFHDVVIWHAAHGTLGAPTGTLDARSDVPTRDESRVTLVLVAQLAHLDAGARGCRGLACAHGLGLTATACSITAGS